MCLTTIANWHRKNNGVGYKAFLLDIHTRKIISPIARTSIILNRWKKARSNNMVTKSYKYHRGFHIFKLKKDAILYSQKVVYADWEELKIIHKVKYKKVICSGYQNHKKTIVADYMLVLPNKKKRTK